MILGIVIGSFVLFLIIVAVRHHRKTIAAREAAWRHFARMQNGEFRIGGGSFWRRQPDVVEYDAGTARVLIDTYTVSEGDSQVTYTRARVHAPLGTGPRFKVYRQGLFSSIGKLLGTQDVVIGRDKTFDDMFMVKADVPGLVRLAWSDRAMEIMRIHFEKAKVESDGREISISVRSHQTDPQILELMGLVVADLGRAELVGLAAFEALPGAEVMRPHGPWDERKPPMAVVPIGPSLVTIAPVLQGSRCVTAAWVNGTREGQAVQFMVGPGRDPEALDRSPIPAEAKERLRAAGMGQLEVGGGQARFVWTGIEADPERLMAAAHALASFTQAPSEGVFR